MIVFCWVGFGGNPTVIATRAYPGEHGMGLAVRFRRRAIQIVYLSTML